MKKRLLYILLASACISQTSCKKTLESIVDCAGETAFKSVHSTIDGTNAKLAHLEARYSGSHSFNSVTWDFGDGKTDTKTAKTIDHLYTAAGTYTVKAKIKIVNGKSNCESTVTKTVVIN